MGTGDAEHGARLIDSERLRRARLKAEIDAQLERDGPDGKDGRDGRDQVDR